MPASVVWNFVSCAGTPWGGSWRTRLNEFEMRLEEWEVDNCMAPPNIWIKGSAMALGFRRNRQSSVINIYIYKYHTVQSESCPPDVNIRVLHGRNRLTLGIMAAPVGHRTPWWNMKIMKPVVNLKRNVFFLVGSIFMQGIGFKFCCSAICEDWTCESGFIMGNLWLESLEATSSASTYGVRTAQFLSASWVGFAGAAPHPSTSNLLFSCFLV